MSAALRARTAAGWTLTDTGWVSPDNLTEADWELEGHPFPEDAGFADWFVVYYHYCALDEGVEPIPYPFAPAQAGE